MKIWIKIYKDGKIRQDLIYNFKFHLTRETYEQALMKICREMDIGTPVSLRTHFQHFYFFNSIKYLPRDFIEPVDFDYMVLECDK